MTILVTSRAHLKAPEWDKSGEKRVLMTKDEQRRTFGSASSPADVKRFLSIGKNGKPKEEPAPHIIERRKVKV